MKNILFLFLSFLIVFTNSNSTSNSNKYDKEKLSAFLQKLNPNTSSKSIEENLKVINSKDKEISTKFRFKNKVSEKVAAKSKTSLPLISEGYIYLNSDFFSINNDFPKVKTPEGEIGYKLDANLNLINEGFDAKDENANNNLSDVNLSFYYRINKDFIYFSPSKLSYHVVFVIKTDTILSVMSENTLELNCIKIATKPIKSKAKPVFKLCGETSQKSATLVCIIRAISIHQDHQDCLKKPTIDVNLKTKIVKRKIHQPYMILLKPQRTCNQEWNYASKGSDWECLCKEGKEQSPIDLPSKEKAIRAPLKPLLRYETFNEVPLEVKIEHNKNTLRILAIEKYMKGFGELVSPDGTVYFATDIIFHTPSEHTIEGKRFPLEIQVLHEAKSVGDFGKKAYFNFLFEGKPGIYNKFIDEIEFFNLPNPHDKERKLHNKLSIYDIFKNISDSSSKVLKPFDLYTYQGSMTQPPCLEKVIHYTVSDPIPASITSIDLIKEALRRPDFEDATTEDIITSKESILENYRENQKLNGRPIFIYSSDYYEPSTVEETNKENPNSQGHYEKVEKEVTDYFFVPGSLPSGVTGAVIVPEDEAKTTK